MAAARRGDAWLAISDFALVRQSRWREAIASIFDDPDFLPYLRSLRRIAVTYATHDETGAPGSTNLVKPIYHVGWLASRLGLKVVRPLVRGRRAGAARERRAARAGAVKPAVGRGLAATLSDGRAEVAVVVRPVVSHDAAGHDPAGRAARRAARLGAAGRRDRRGRDRPRPRLAGRRRGARSPLPGAAAGEVDLLAEAIESGRRDPVAVGALRSAAELIGPTEGSRVSEPEIDRRRRPGGVARRGRRTGSPRPWPMRSTARGRADWATTGGSTPVATLPAAGGPAAGRRGPVGRHPRLVGRRPVRAARPSAVERQALRRHPARHRRRRGRDRRRGYAGVPLPVENIHPFPTGEAIGAGRGAAWCAAALADELRAARLPQQDGWPVFDLMLLGIGRDGHILSVFPGSSAFDATELGAGHPGADPHRAACRAGDAQPGGHRGRPAACSSSRPARTRPRSSPTSSGRIGDPRRWPAQLAGARARPGSSTRRPPSRCPAGDSRRRLHRGEPVRRAPRGDDPARPRDDGPALGDVWLAAWHATFDFPPSHPDDDVRRWLRDRDAAEARDMGRRPSPTAGWSR